MKKIITTAILLLCSLIGKSQGFIGETEQQIRSENPKATFHMNYDGGVKSMAVVDEDGQMNFQFNSKGICFVSTLYIYKQEALDLMVRTFNEKGKVLTKGQRWLFTHKGYSVYASLNYSTKMGANALGFYSEQLKTVKTTARKQPARTVKTESDNEQPTFSELMQKNAPTQRYPDPVPFNPTVGNGRK
jgi:hypothetical protein